MKWKISTVKEQSEHGFQKQEKHRNKVTHGKTEMQKIGNFTIAECQD